MAKPISPLMRQRLTQQRASLSQSLVISMKDFTQAKFRALPIPDSEPTPGTKYIQVFSKALSKGCTSPAAYGKPCPIIDKLAQLKQGKSTDEKKEIDALVNVSSEYWIPVIRRTEGDGVPKIEILPCKKKPYTAIVDFMLADEGENITDPDEGRDFLYKKTGTGQSSEYSVAKFYDCGPIHDDPEVQAEILKNYAVFDVTTRFWPVDWDLLEKMHQLLSDGESIPPEYKAAFDVQTEAPADEDEEELPVSPKVSKVAAKKTAPVAEPEVEETTDNASDTASLELEIGSLVSFEASDGTHTGRVTTIGDPDEEGDVQLDVVSDNDGGVYSIWTSTVTLLEGPEAPVEESPAEEPEPVEVEPTKPAPKAPVKKAAPTPVAPPKPAPKAPVKQPVIAAKPPVKPAPTPPKSAAKPPIPPKKPAMAPAKAPTKPAAPASSAIAKKLATMKG